MAADIVVSGGDLLLLLLVPLLFIVLAVIALFFFLRTVAGRGIEIEEIEETEQPARARPWWANPFVWIGVSVVFLLLGVFVAPHFLGGTFVFLPFFWIGRSRRIRVRSRTRTEPPDERAR